MHWFILLFPLLIYPWGPDPYYTVSKMLYLNSFIVSIWILLLFKRKEWTRFVKEPFTKLELVTIVFLGLVILSTIFSVEPKTSLFGAPLRYEGLLTLFSYCSCLLLAYRLTNPALTKKIVTGLIAVGVIVSIYGIMQHYLIDFLPRVSIKVGYDRSYSFFDNPNFFGSYLVIIMMLAISVYLTAMDKKVSAASFVSISLVFATMIFTSTRSSWVGAFIALVFVTLFVVWKKRTLWKKWVALLATLMLVAILIDFSEGGKYFSRALTSVAEPYRVVTDQNSGNEGSGRWLIWSETIPLLKKYALLGSGPDTFESIFPQKEFQELKNDPEVNVDKAHNEYLQMAVTLGFPVLFVYLSLISLIIIQAFRAIKIAKEQDFIYLSGMVAAIVGYLVQAFFNISVVPVAPIFWFLLGLTYAYSGICLRNSKVKNKESELLLTA